MPIFERGSSQCRAQNCWRDNTYVRARSCSLLSSFKKGKAFSLHCLSPLLPPRLAWGILNHCGLGCYGAAWSNQQGQRPAGLKNRAGRWRKPRDLPSSGGLYQPPGRNPHQTREPRGLLPSGGNSEATFLSHECPAPYGRGEGCRGSPPAHSPVTKVYRASAASFRRGPGRETSLESALKIASFWTAFRVSQPARDLISSTGVGPSP